MNNDDIQLLALISNMHEKKFENIMKLSNLERYEYLIRKVADFEEIYLIYGNLAEMYIANINGVDCPLVFPEKGFAEIFTSKNFNSKVRKVDLYQFLDWLGKDEEDSLKIAVFPDINNNASIVNASKLRADLLEECKQYE